MILANEPPKPLPIREPLFQVGQIVEHRRYGYRGVIVALDGECLADESWYQNNQTQPDRKQPWYHVLVDCSTHTTYAAQENLASAGDRSPVQHPLMDAFFLGYSDGRHLRNERPFPP